MVGITLDKLYGDRFDDRDGHADQGPVAERDGLHEPVVRADRSQRSEQRRHPRLRERPGRRLSDRSATGDATKLGSYGTVGAGQGDLERRPRSACAASASTRPSTSAPRPTDYLAKIDPATWKATPLGTGTGYSNIFGLGFWAGTIYGFIDAGAGAGKMITIDQTTGAGTADQRRQRSAGTVPA